MLCLRLFWVGLHVHLRHKPARRQATRPLIRPDHVYAQGLCVGEPLQWQQAQAARVQPPLHDAQRQPAPAQAGFQQVGAETLVAVAAPHHPLLQTEALGEAHLAATRQIVIAGRDTGVADTRVLFARHLWHTDSPEAACGLLEAGLGWGWLPLSIVQWRLDAGSLRLLPLQGLTNAQPLCVDVVWSNERPRGLAARRFVEQMRMQMESN